MVVLTSLCPSNSWTVSRRAGIVAVLQQMCGEGMPKRVGGDTFGPRGSRRVCVKGAITERLGGLTE
jgi:hypothetical protein